MHTFRCVGKDGDFGVMEFGIIPAVGFGGVLKALFGQQQEGIVNSRGEMPFLQAMVAFRGYRSSKGLSFPDLAIMVPPGKAGTALANILSFVIAPLGRLFGYKPDSPQYNEDEFWEKRVNQPPK